MNTLDAWPAGATYVIQGTVAEDATGGTHVCSLTVTPGAGNEMQVLYGSVVAGAGAANLTDVTIDDGTNLLAWLVPTATSLGSGGKLSFPAPAGAGTGQPAIVATPIIISGVMRLKLQTSTATASLTQTFAVVLRIKGGAPTSVLADTVGTPTLTFNTRGVF